MRRLLLIAALCFLAVATTGCKKAQLRRQLKELMGSTIVLPENITCVNNGEIYPMPDSLRDKAKLIIYIDSTECTTCRISHIREYESIFSLARKKGFETVLLLSNTQFNSVPLVRYVSDLEIPFPVFVDEQCRYLPLNPQFPSDIRLHTCLVDYDNRVCLIGDPVQSKKVFHLIQSETLF